MLENKQSPETVPQESLQSSGVGDGNAEESKKVSPDSSQSVPATQEEVPKELEFINKATGRQYKSLEDAEKGLKETVGYVGKLGKHSQVLEKLADKVSKETNVSKEAALQYIESLAGDATPAPLQEESQPQQKSSPQDFQYHVLQEQLSEEKLLRKVPEAEAHINLIRNVAKATGKDHLKVWEEDIRPILQEGKKEAYQTQTSKEGSQVLTSDKGAVDITPTANQVLEAWKKNPKKVSVQEVLRAKGLRIVPRE